MSITKYEVFLKSVELGSFTRAGEELNITQSGVSHTVAALEKELGLHLLIRSKGGVTLTADGAALLPRMQALCEEERKLQEKAQELRGLDTGTVRIASFTSVAVKWLPKILTGFRSLHPGVEFRLLTSHDDRQTERMVMNGEADCGFLCLPAELDVDCETLGERLAEDGICVRAGLHCAPAAHASAGTLETGTVRFSFSPVVSEGDVLRACAVLKSFGAG